MSARSEKTTFRREFFDRDYTVREAYSRALRYARPYRLRIAAGLVCGLLTAGTLVPLFQLVQPAVGQFASLGAQPGPAAESAVEPKAPHAKMPGGYREAEKLSRRLGFSLVDESGAMGGPLLLMALLVVPAVAGARLLLKYLNGYCLAWAATHAVSDLSCDMLRHVQDQSLQFYARVDVGQLMSRVSHDPREIRTIIRVMMAEFAEAPFEIAVAVCYVVWFAVRNDMLPTLFVIAVAFPAFLFPVKRIGFVIRRWSRQALQRAAMLLGRVHEVLTCIKLVKSANAEEHENGLYREANRQQVKIALKAARAGLSVAPALEMIGVMLLCGLVAWCFLQRVSLDRVLPMLAPLLVIYKPVKKLSKLQVQIEGGMAALSRVFSLLDVHMEIPECAHPAVVGDFARAIRFEDVSFKYDTADGFAVRHATFELLRGSTVAVVGGTGSGKTTLASLLARFADPTEGRVTIDGKDLRDVAFDELRRLVGVVTQEAQLFNATIAENIAYGRPDAAEEAVVAAAKLAHVHDFVVSQPGGYARLAGEKGLALSGGERQRIAIARAVLRNPPILVLDEATSALDTVTEAQVQAALDNLMANRTTFVVAHRLATVRHADLILVMDRGEIVERGTHDELLARNGRYARLCRMQEVG
ncbi:MAG: ABC transporter ATP-binding protein [Kiritimatiellae bacterium]|nr:ABC transporter ATP-binding protein [Kiritimatiellia bacterium]